VLALVSLAAPWDQIRTSMQWLVSKQGADGGWNFPGTLDGHERLIYTLYPTLAILRGRAHLGRTAKTSLSRVSTFIETCEERKTPFWTPFRNHLRTLLGTKTTDDASLDDYWHLFVNDWPTEHVAEDWLPKRFSMALMCGPNYLLLRHQLRPDHPLALLHIRHLADERIGNGWSDNSEDQQPKTWATALGALTLYRWGCDVRRLNIGLTRLPTRSELVKRLQVVSVGTISEDAHALVRRFSRIRPGPGHATKYQALIRDVFTFLFGDILRDPKLESKTIFGTLRRDVTFSNAADTGPWSDWKREHHVLSVLIECKNQNELTYKDLRQTACYLGKIMGYFGIVVSRMTTADEMREILNWFVINDSKYILIVNDQSLMDWIGLKDRGEDPTDAITDLHRSLRERAQ